MYIYIIYTSIYIYLYNKSVRAAGCNVWFDPPQKQTHPCMSDRHVDYIYIYIYIYIIIISIQLINVVIVLSFQIISRIFLIYFKNYIFSR